MFHLNLALGLNSKDNHAAILFAEMEGLFSFLLYKSLDLIILNKQYFSSENSLNLKYLQTIKSIHPNIAIKFKDILYENSSKEDFLLYPKIENIFKDGSLKSLYQPILNDHELLGYECLSRISYKNTNYPSEVIFKYAEERLKAKDYDQLCLSQALYFSPKEGHKKIFLNIRPQTLLCKDFLPWFLDAIKNNHFEPDQIVIEITEQHGFVKPLELALHTNKLKKLGIKLAIDDFGSGQSNLVLLESLAPDYIKICGELVRDIDTNINKQIIVLNLISLCKSLNITPIVESIETLKEWEKIKEFGHLYGQGYYFAKPKEAFDLKTNI